MRMGPTTASAPSNVRSPGIPTKGSNAATIVSKGICSSSMTAMTAAPAPRAISLARIGTR